jgi:hypothetical protein
MSAYQTEQFDRPFENPISQSNHWKFSTWKKKKKKKEKKSN